MSSPHGLGRGKRITDETQQMVNAWLSVDWDPESREHVKGLVAAGKEEELVAHLGRRISFGTAGLRGKMKWGFAHMNAVTVTQASQGLCAYLRTVHPCLSELRQMGVIVGHDGRYNSRLFARLTAAVFLSRKIKVRLLRFLSFRSCRFGHISTTRLLAELPCTLFILFYLNT
jgi:CRP-like cAMP-binding protein